MKTSPGLHGVRTVALSVDDYERDVLPYRHLECADTRSFEEHLAGVRAVAASRFGRQRRHLVGLADGEEIASSLKLYARSLRMGERMLRATGTGDLFTPPHLRGRGYATMLLASVLDEERAAGRDFVFVFSGIGTAFYEALGFRLLPSRTISFGTSALEPARVDMSVLQEEDWRGVAACAGRLHRRGHVHFTRPPAVWEWLRLRWSAPDAGLQPVKLVSRRNDRIVAFVVGRRDPEHDCFIVDDYALGGPSQRGALHHLLSAAAGDLRRIRGWLPPEAARPALPRGIVGTRKRALLLALPLSAAGRDWVAQAERPGLPCDPVWAADSV